MPYIDKEDLESNLERQIGWVRASESRLNLVLPLGTLLFGIIAAKLDQIPDDQKAVLFASWSSIVLISLSITLAAISILPRTKGPTGSVLYFGSIAKIPLDKFKDEIDSSDQSSYRSDLINQIHRNSQIAEIRYRLMKYSILALLFSFPFWGYAASHLY
ncbi:MAG: Pycsar system effector family protein [Pseudomonadota bacterium]